MLLMNHEPLNETKGLNESVLKSRQKWDHNESRCKCKELDHWSSCKDNHM